MDPLHLHPGGRPSTCSLGESLLTEVGRSRTSRRSRRRSPSPALLAGRIEFFDLTQPAAAAESFVRALQAAGEAGDSLLGAAILAHAAFVPGLGG